MPESTDAMRVRILSKENFFEICIEAVQIIASGGIVALPTDTVYGLVCDARNRDAIARVFQIKRRPDEKAFPIFVRDVVMARQYACISDSKVEFLERVWPGPVTAVFHHKEKLPSILTGDKDTIGIRIPDHPFIAALLAQLDAPLVQTSANISDMPPAKTAAEAAAYFEKNPEQPDLVIDGGTVAGISSTVIDCTGASPLILRSGMVTKADIDRMLGTS